VKDVFLDGNLVEHVMELDTDEGWVRCLLGMTGDDQQVTEQRYGHVTFTWRDDVKTTEVVVLHGRRGTYHLSRRGWMPACGSKDEIAGFHYSKDGVVVLPPDAREHLCARCAKSIGVLKEQAGAGPNKGES